MKLSCNLLSFYNKNPAKQKKDKLLVRWPKQLHKEKREKKEKKDKIEIGLLINEWINFKDYTNLSSFCLDFYFKLSTCLLFLCKFIFISFFFMHDKKLAYLLFEGFAMNLIYIFPQNIYVSKNFNKFIQLFLIIIHEYLDSIFNCNAFIDAINKMISA